MKLIRKGFRAGTGRATHLLLETLKAPKGEYKFFISTELRKDELAHIMQVRKIDLSSIQPIKVFTVPEGMVEEKIKEIIFSMEGVPETEHLSFYIHARHDIYFEQFKDLKNVTFHHYFQVNRDSRINSSPKVTDYKVGETYTIIFDNTGREPRRIKILRFDGTRLHAVDFDNGINYAISHDDLATLFVVLK